MRVSFAAVLAAAFATTTAFALALSPPLQIQAKVENDAAFDLIPASEFAAFDALLDGSINHCGSAADVFAPETLSMSPDPPKRGARLDVAVVGSLSEDVLDGAYINVVVKLGIIKLYQGKLNLCEESGKIGHACPIAKGRQEVYHSVDFPREVPPGTYDVAVRAFTVDDKPLTCLNIRIKL